MLDNDVAQRLLGAIEELKAEVRAMREEAPSCGVAVENGLYTNKEVREILDVDDRLIRKYRDSGLLGYSRHGDKYWYRGEDILDFIARGHVKAFA